MQASPVLVAGLALAAALPLPAQEAPRKRITVEQALGGEPDIDWFSSPPRARWAPDGEHVELRDGEETVWIDPSTLERSAPPDAKGPRAGDRGRNGRGRRVGDEPDAEGRRIVLDSPAGDLESFVLDHDLVIARADGGEAWRVTDDGSEDLLYGILDWVYQEEVYGRGDFQGHWWAPGGDLVVFLRIDEGPVKDFTVIDHVPEKFLEKERSVIAEVTPYPKAGDPNPVVGVGIADVAAREVRWVDLADWPEDRLVVRVTFTPDGGRAVLQVQDRIQTWMDLVYVDLGTGATETVLREESDTWVNRLPAPRWLGDGTFLWFSERTGYRHLYHYRADGTLIGAVTEGEWQVRDLEHVDEERGLVWFEGTRDGAIDRNLYRVALDGSGLVRLTRGEGQHRVSFDGERRFFLDRVSAIETPEEVRLCRADTGEVVQVLGRAGPKDALAYAYSAKRRLTIPARDGYRMDGSVVLPTGPVREGGAPIYVKTYSGPDASSVRNRHSVSTHDQFLAQLGVITLRCNVRSASGRGQAHTGKCYRQLGVQELKDLEDAVRFTVEQFSGDPDRVAIDGWSYGGFMAAYALTHSDVFSLGFAGAGVHDWRLYDTIYTERYMSTPQDNPEGYARTSVIGAAGDLQGHLVILHGTKDDNVHVQNALQLVYALQKAGVQDFDMMLYPRSRHGVRRDLRDHMKRFKWNVLRREFGLRVE